MKQREWQLSFEASVEIPIKVIALCELYLKHFPEDARVLEIQKTLVSAHYTNEDKKRLAQILAIGYSD